MFRFNQESIMQLVYDSTQKPVQIGDVVHVLDSDTPYILLNIIEPHKPASTGRVHIQSMDERKYFCEYFPSVIGASWIGRTDR
jgi:hypothetical protein